MKNVITKTYKNGINGFSNRLETLEGRIIKLRNWSTEILRLKYTEKN